MLKRERNWQQGVGEGRWSVNFEEMVLGRCKGCEERISARSKDVWERWYCKEFNEVLLNSAGKGKNRDQGGWGGDGNIHLKGISFTISLLNEQLAHECLFMASSVAKDQCWWICLSGLVIFFVSSLLETLFVRHEESSPMTAIGTSEDSPCCFCWPAGCWPAPMCSPQRHRAKASFDCLLKSCSCCCPLLCGWAVRMWSEEVQESWRGQISSLLLLCELMERNVLEGEGSKPKQWRELFACCHCQSERILNIISRGSPNALYEANCLSPLCRGPGPPQQRLG